MLTAEEIRKKLKLQPHPEGGYFIETYRSTHKLPKKALTGGYPGDRAVSTAIYYLLTPKTFSAVHRLRGDEVFHFYGGDAVDLLQLYPDGTGKVSVLGSNLAAGMRPQLVVPGGVWQGMRLLRGGKYALMGTTVAPGFDFKDFELGHREELVEEYPQFAEMIRHLTK
jgi:predicted cupin superfamily sugar epimerase